MNTNAADIVARLRRWTYAVDAAPVIDLMDEAAREIEMLRSGAVESRETVRLTDEERRAVWHFAKGFKGKNAATLRSLLERTNHDAAPTAIARTDSATGEPGSGHGSDGTDKPVTRPVLGIGNICESGQ